MSAGRDLDHLLARARQAEVRPELAAAAVTAATRAAHERAVAPRAWWPRVAVGAGLALALAAVVLLAWPRRAAPPPAAVVAIGDRVAIAVSPGGRYAVAAADGDHTVVVVERGAVTARLWPGARPHRLALRGADVEATATGTVFTVAVDERGATVRVHEGTVQVIAADGAHAVAAGAWWPDGRAGRTLGSGAAAQLRALPAPRGFAPDVPAPTDTTAPTATTPPDAVALAPDAAAPTSDAASAAPPPPSTDAAVAIDASSSPRDPSTAPPPIDAGATAPSPVPLNERWRRARLLRAQGQADAARTACLDIAAAGDPTWSPIALVEAIRIDLDARSAPEAALTLADQMLARWPAHALITETRALRCRALRQLGRGAACAPP
ncbi:MAG: hypothetical protein JNK64_00210 [Myxococcales bacterium]|nr:hypothetical protein [Myxococcales bacterium]